ncbi:MAG: TetR/AcrR family transcriptional regulator [Acidimicrobiales bacterium]
MARPQRLQAARRRKQLLEVAVELFGQRGFHDTSMEDIAEEAGVTKPVVYQHFSSKSELYLELVELVGRQLLEAVAGSATAEPSPHQRVLAGFRAYFHFVSRRTNAFKLLFGTDARRSDEFAVAFRGIEESVADTIATFINADIDDEHRALLGYAIVGLAEVAGRHWVQRAEGRSAGSTSAPVLDPEEGELMARRLADLAWAGLRALPGSERRP